MAGDIKRQRKSWTLQDRSKMSLNILRANYAEEGDESAQLEVAKRLLEEDSSESDGNSENTGQNENARKALYWLIKSSEQGNDEATQMLKDCLQTGRGITAQNILDVRMCVTTPKYEKLTFKAARTLYNILSNGEEFITTTQLLARVKMNRNNLTFMASSNGSAGGGAVGLEGEELFPLDENNILEENNSEHIFNHHQQQQEQETNSSFRVPTSPPTLQGLRKLPPKNSQLNTTFVVQNNDGSSYLNSNSTNRRPASSRDRSPNTPTIPSLPTFKTNPTSPAQVARAQPSPAVINHVPSTRNHINLDHHQQQQQLLQHSLFEQNAEVQLAMVESGKKLTLNDLLDVAKDFNLGKSPQVSLDVKNRILKRHVWHANSFLNTFILQLVILAIVGNILAPMEALHYLILFGTMWSSYNLLSWKKRSENFKDWELAFRSVLQGETWKTEQFEKNLSKGYLLPHLINITLSLIFLSYFLPQGNYFCCYFVVVSFPTMASARLGIQRGSVLQGWRQILILCTALMHYHPSTISSSNLTNLLSENLTEQTKFLHESLNLLGGESSDTVSVIRLLPFPVNGFTLSTIFVLATAVKPSLTRIVYETLPEIVFSLWLIKLVQTVVILEAGQLVVGIGAGVFLTTVMVLLSSKGKTWKVLFIIFSGIMVAAAIVTVIMMASTTSYFPSNGGITQERGEISYLEWEEYEASCHRKAWAVQSPAATQIKCSNMYETVSHEVKWKGRVSIVKIEKLSRSSSLLANNAINDVVFDISVGILANVGQDDGGSRNWQAYLSGSSDSSSDTLAPASVIVSTEQIKDKKKKQNLIDHILNLRTGDKIEFVGKLKGSTAGSLKPAIVDIQSLQCLSCVMADYGEFTVENKMGNIEEYKLGFGLDWLISQVWDPQQTLKEYPIVGNCKQLVMELYATLKNTFVSS